MDMGPAGSRDQISPELKLRIKGLTAGALDNKSRIESVQVSAGEYKVCGDHLGMEALISTGRRKLPGTGMVTVRDLQII